VWATLSSPIAWSNRQEAETVLLCRLKQPWPSDIVASLNGWFRYDDTSNIRFFMVFSSIALARHAGATLATFWRILPWKMGMILADPAEAETVGTVGFHRSSKARGPCSKLAKYRAP
jgi:hypothetical protein